MQYKILESRQSDKFLFMKVQFTASSFFGLWNCSNVHWVYMELDCYGIGTHGYLKTKDTNEYISVKYGSEADSCLIKEAKQLTKEHQKFKEHLENQFLTAK